MPKRVKIKVWGAAAGRFNFASFAIVPDGESSSYAIARSIARTTGLEWCGGPCGDGYNADSMHYHGTLGKPIPRKRGGGWSVVAELWFSVPRGENGADPKGADHA